MLIVDAHAQGPSSTPCCGISPPATQGHGVRSSYDCLIEAEDF